MTNIVRNTYIEACPVGQSLPEVAAFTSLTATSITNSGALTSEKIGLSATDAATSGTNAKNTIDVTVAPSSSSTQVFFGERVQITYNSTQNMAVGGYICPVQYVCNTAGSGTHDKIVGTLLQHNPTGGNVTALVGNESEIGSLGASTLIGNYVANYVPDMSGVTNIGGGSKTTNGNVSNIYSFACEHYLSKMKNTGQYMKAVDALGAASIMQEISPSYHPGYVASQYYGPRGRTGAVTPIALTQNVVYMTPIHIAERTAFTKIGCNVTTAVAASNIHIGLYYVTGGQLSTRIIDTGDISSATTGVKETTITSTVLEAGTYMAVIQCSGVGVSVNGVTLPALLDMFGVSTNTGVDCTPYYNPGAYAAFPSPFGFTIAYADTSLVVPFIWLRK